MKKVLVILMALIMACFSISAFAVDYSDAEVKASIEFEGITDADLGGASEIIGDFDPHGTWQHGWSAYPSRCSHHPVKCRRSWVSEDRSDAG